VKNISEEKNKVKHHKPDEVTVNRPVVAIMAADGEEKEGKIVTMILNDVRGTDILWRQTIPPM
jgi:hypothetical protein